MRSYYLTHKSGNNVDARAICDKINKQLGDAGCTTEEDVLAEIANLDPEQVELYGIHADSVEVQGE